MRSIFIPYHDYLDFRCDFVLQTVKILLKSGYKIYLITFNHPKILFYRQQKKINPSPILKKLLTNHNFKIIYPYYLFPCIRPFRRIWKINHDLFIKNLINKILKSESAIIWCFQWNEIIEKVKLKKTTIKVVYDLVDFYSSKNPKTNKEIQENERKLVKYVDYFFVNSQILKKVKQQLFKNIKIVPLGFDIDSFMQKNNSNRLMVKKMFAKITEPRIGLVGHISMRLEFNLLIKLINMTPKISYVFTDLPLVFSNDDKYFNVKQNILKLKTFDNVYFIPSQSDRNIIKYIIEQFNICMIPYNLTHKLNKYCYPMKIMEYFYMGKPVISTPIEELKRFSNLIEIGSNETDWKKNINKLLSRKWIKENQHKQRSIALKNNWENKVKIMIKMIMSN